MKKKLLSLGLVAGLALGCAPQAQASYALEGCFEGAAKCVLDYGTVGMIGCSIVNPSIGSVLAAVWLCTLDGAASEEINKKACRLHGYGEGHVLGYLAAFCGIVYKLNKIVYNAVTQSGASNVGSTIVGI